MAEAPMHNWPDYAAAIAKADADWIRSLTLKDRLAIYEDTYNLIAASRDDNADWERLERWRWTQKLALRARMVDGFLKLDRIGHGSSHSANTR
jgi:hypothetical protein